MVSDVVGEYAAIKLQHMTVKKWNVFDKNRLIAERYVSKKEFTRMS